MLIFVLLFSMNLLGCATLLGMIERKIEQRLGRNKRMISILLTVLLGIFFLAGVFKLLENSINFFRTSFWISYGTLLMDGVSFLFLVGIVGG